MLSSDQSEAEKTLRTLTPAVPSEAFQRRIEADFRRVKSKRVRFGNPVLWFGIASLAAACLAMLLYLPLAFEEGEGTVLEAVVLEESVLSPPLPAHSDEMVRVRRSSELIEVEKGPVYYDANGLPTQDSVFRYLDVEVFERVSDKEEITTRTIREEVRSLRVDVD